MSISELYAILTLKHHLSPSYVLDEMEWYEINAIMKYEYYSTMDNWEAARMITYMIAQTNSKKKLTFQDIVKFYWEEEQEQHDTSISKEDIERLKIKAKQMMEWQKLQST